MPQPLRVAIVAASLRILGGHAVQAQRMLDGWRGDPHLEAWLVPIDPLPPPPLDRLRRVAVARTLVTQLAYWPALVRELRHADVVHVFSAAYTSFLLAPLPAVLVARQLGRPVILNYHSGEAPDHLRRPAVARHVLRHAVDLTVVPSAFLRDVFTAFGIQATVVPNTIDLARCAYRAREPLRPHLLCTRNFDRIYNVACVLRAFARVRGARPDARLTLVGAGPEEPALRALAAELGLHDVTFAGRVPPSEIHRYYADADIYVQAPAIDNMPLSLPEAFASGLPVVSTRVGGVPAMLTDGVHGLLAPANDDAAIAGCVLRLLDSPAYARMLAAAARATCIAYEWPATRELWRAAYESVLTSRGRAGRPTSSRASI
ncbi:MAG: glycosyltransferase family 4 protein [Acidimicrobiia bacterium]|nr:glycosyltransferase family 4 protein [Acidimicrobiia bacterium]